MALGSPKKAKDAPPAQTLKGITAPFDAKARIKMQNMDISADINRTSEKCITIKINEPSSIKGMAFSYNGEDITASFKGLTATLDENSKLVSSMAEIIVNSLDKAAEKEGVGVSLDGGAVLIDGKGESGEFQIRLDKNDGSLATLSLPELDFECRFDDFIFS